MNTERIDVPAVMVKDANAARMHREALGVYAPSTLEQFKRESGEAYAAVAELIEAGRELVKAEAEYHRLVNEGLPAALAWNRVTAARHRHAAALARVQGGAA